MSDLNVSPLKPSSILPVHSIRLRFVDIFCVVLCSWVSSGVLGVALGVMREGSDCYSISAWRRGQAKNWQSPKGYCDRHARHCYGDRRRTKGWNPPAERGDRRKDFSSCGGALCARMRVCQLLESPLNDFANRISSISGAGYSPERGSLDRSRS